MLKVYPDYYENFKCIADKCRHNCCIGWEIDIDDETFEFYKSCEGEFGQRLKNNIEGNPAHFILAEKERCPFLNSNNLCDIIINLGEEKICEICKEHPRFHNDLPDRVESGLGLCCEEAARIILGNADTVGFIKEGKSKIKDEIIDLRDKAIKILQNRNKGIEDRLKEVFSLFDEKIKNYDIKEWVDEFLSLERLDDEWTDILIKLKENIKNADFSGFSNYMLSRQTEYEQFLVYVFYRYFANSFDFEEALKICKFALLSYNLIYSIGAVFFTLNGDFLFENQVNICRLFSAEIEYSTENFDYIIEKL
jgi:lysine-N-methylase